MGVIVLIAPRLLAKPIASAHMSSALTRWMHALRHQTAHPARTAPSHAHAVMVLASSSALHPARPSRPCHWPSASPPTVMLLSWCKHTQHVLQSLVGRLDFFLLCDRLNYSESHWF